MLRTLLRYIFQVDPHSWKKQQQVIQRIKSQIVKEKIITLGESLKIEGRKEGEKKGFRKLTLQLLEDAVGPLPASLKKAVGKLSPKALATLARSAHSFKRIEDLEQWLGNKN